MNKPIAACLRSLVLLSAWALGVLSVALPVAAQQTYYIYADHLDTPRLITDGNQDIRWRWDNDDPFGGNMANANPSGLGTFEFNLRFPGQYFDRETNQHYNYFRDYSPEIGRYIQCDPIGLLGGINTYAYVDSNPLSLIDSKGLQTASATAIPWWGSGTGSGVGQSIGGVCIGGIGLGVSLLLYTGSGQDACADDPGRQRNECKGGDDDYCYKRFEREQNECFEKYGGPSGCLHRAQTRWDQCNRGVPEVPKWGDADVDGWAPPKAPWRRK